FHDLHSFPTRRSSDLRGEKQLHPKATNLLLSHVTDETSVSDELNLASLSPREMDVLHQISLGKSNKQIASELYITEKTVKTHVRDRKSTRLNSSHVSI